MKIYLADQREKFDQHLEFLKKRDVLTYDKSCLTEIISSIEINTLKSMDQLSFDFLFDYHIFPRNIMAYKNQWNHENRKMRIGDTIVQQVFFPPINSFSQKLVFGVRINEIIDQTDRKGFSYETLQGHVEQGISTFTIEQNNDRLIFKIQTYSTPTGFLAKMFGRIFTVPYQAYCTRAALKNVKKHLENQ